MRAAWWDLVGLGLGGMVGAGVFVTTGRAARLYARPGLVVSYAIAGLCALLSAFCYTEFAVDMPVAGGASSYLLVTFGGGAPALDKPKQRTSIFLGRSTAQDRSQCPRSMSFIPERIRVMGRSPAFTALAATFESSSNRNLLTPRVVKKLYLRYVTPDSSNTSKSSVIAALAGSLDRPSQTPAPAFVKDGSESEKPKQKGDGKGVHTVVTRVESLTINEDVKENKPEDEDSLPIYLYERLKTTTTDPVTEIDVTRQEVISRSHITFLFQKNVMVTLFSIWHAGEFAAFLTGANLIMEYVFSNVAVARSFTVYLGTAVGVDVPSKWRIPVPGLPQGFNQVDLVAVGVILLLSVCICYRLRFCLQVSFYLSFLFVLSLVCSPLADTELLASDFQMF
ncbi:Cationic amino acid transporter 5 [Zea mays]|uniref:Cationic amino acid transporter 5 n=1 Tax=Zea mays TaxID=4577 RepID=A0A1D6J149_MAIZE|nr:Cationic amino acid transporter 5 [Zea mays]